MDNKPQAYGNLCSLFYDATKAYAPEAEVNFYASFIAQNPGRVLEAMSGSGRLQIPLMQRGYVVDGVDNSAIMLERCRTRCAELGLTPEIYEQSLEALNLPHKYATITIAVGSFQLICNRVAALQVLKNLRAHMLPGANLLIDIFTPDLTMDPRSVRLARIDDRTVVRLTTRHVFNEVEKIASSFCNYELLVDGLVQQYEHELIEVTWYSDAELYELFAQAGLKIIKIHDAVFRASGPSRVVQACIL